MKLVSSRDNPLFKSLLKLVQDSRTARKQAKALLDGPHLLVAYRDSGGVPQKLLVSESGMRRSEVQQLVESCAGSETVMLKDSLFKLLSSVESPVGIAAIIDVPASPASFEGGSCVLLDDIQDAGNVGSIIRTSAAMGVCDLFLGPGCAGAWTPRVLRAAQGAHFRVRLREQADLGQVLRAYRGTSLATVVADGIPLYDMSLSGNIAWIFGSEGQGVSADLAALASQRVTIPMAAEIESINVAAAAAICLSTSSKTK